MDENMKGVLKLQGQIMMTLQLGHSKASLDREGMESLLGLTEDWLRLKELAGE